LHVKKQYKITELEQKNVSGKYIVIKLHLPKGKAFILYGQPNKGRIYQMSVIVQELIE